MELKRALPLSVAWSVSQEKPACPRLPDPWLLQEAPALLAWLDRVPSPIEDSAWQRLVRVVRSGYLLKIESNLASAAQQHDFWLAVVTGLLGLKSGAVLPGYPARNESLARRLREALFGILEDRSAPLRALAARLLCCRELVANNPAETVSCLSFFRHDNDPEVADAIACSSGWAELGPEAVSLERTLPTPLEGRPTDQFDLARAWFFDSQATGVIGLDPDQRLRLGSNLGLVVELLTAINSACQLDGSARQDRYLWVTSLDTLFAACDRCFDDGESRVEVPALHHLRPYEEAGVWRRSPNPLAGRDLESRLFLALAAELVKGDEKRLAICRITQPEGVYRPGQEQDGQMARPCRPVPLADLELLDLPRGCFRKLFPA